MLSGEGGGSEVEAEAEAEGVGELGGLFCGGRLLDAPAYRSEVSFAPGLQMTRILWTIGSKHLSHKCGTRGRWGTRCSRSMFHRHPQRRVTLTLTFTFTPTLTLARTAECPTDPK